MSDDFLLQVDGVSFSYGSRAVVSDVGLSITTGEIVAVLGHSGCGKSTLLRLIAGLERPDNGRILMQGRSVADERGVLPPEQRGLGLVFQEDALFPHMSVLDNVAFGVRGVSATERRERAATALARLGLAEKAHDFPHQLSGGEQQRVAVARALAPRPSLVLMDEPFSRLDSDLRRAIREDVISALRETGVGVVLVTHDAEEAMVSADRLVLMARGRVMQSGAPEDCYRRPVSLDAGRLLGPLNALPVAITPPVASTPFGPLAAPGIGDSTALLAFRPENPRVSGQGAEALVVGRTYMGASSRLRVRLADGEFDLAWTGPMPAVGDVLKLSLPDDEAIFFEVPSG
jgi:iron(III) transport system ATP-binding protein